MVEKDNYDEDNENDYDDEQTLNDELVVEAIYDLLKDMKNRKDGLKIIRSAFKDPRFLKSVVPTIKGVKIVAIVGDEEKTFAEITPLDEKKLFVDYKGKKRNPDRVVIDSVIIPYVGKFELYYWKNAPEIISFGLITAKGEKYYRRLDKYECKDLWSMFMRGANKMGIIGQYSPKKVKKRIEKLQKRLDSKKGETLA